MAYEVKSKMDNLTEKQRLYCITYQKHSGNNSAACREMGISDRMGRNYLQKPHVREYLQELAKAGGENILSISQLMEYATNVLKGDVYDEQLNYNTGQIVKVKVPHSVKQKYFDSLVKMQGGFVTQIDINHNHDLIGIEEVKKAGFRLGTEIIEAKDFEWIDEPKEEE